MEAGYLSVEIEELNIALTAALGDGFTVRIDAEIKGPYDIFQWASTGNTKYSTSTFTPVLQEKSDVQADEGDGSGKESKSEVFSYIHGFSNVFLRSTYIDLNEEVINGLANSSLVFTILSVNSNPPVAAVPAKKGQPPPVQEPAEKSLYSLSLPLSQLLLASNCSKSIYDSFATQLANSPGSGAVIIDSGVIADQSTFVVKIYGDNEMAEYVLGSKIISWPAALLQSPPVQWTLLSPDAVDAKAKKQPTAADLREKYLQNISNLISTQESVLTYSIEVGSDPEAATTTAAADDDDLVGEKEEEEAASGVATASAQVGKILSQLKLAEGKLSFDHAAAAEFAPEDDIRSMSNLWTVKWGESGTIFLHRSKVRTLVNCIASNPTAAQLPVVIKRTPTVAAADSQGSELTATATVNLASIIEPGKASLQLPLQLSWSGEVAPAAEAATSFTISYSSGTTALVPARALDSLQKAKKNPQSNSFIPDGVLSESIPSSNDPNKDILSDLRKEISGCIERIAQEYLSLYPEPIAATTAAMTSSAAAGDVDGGASITSRGVGSRSGIETASNGSQEQPESKEDRIADFIDFLAKNGIFHELKESLKPRVQLLIRQQYGTRGRALGRSEALAAIDLAATVGTADGKQLNASSVESILSELYVFLVKQCSVVLNSLFKATVVDRDVKDFERSALVNDEVETESQLIARLLFQAEDAAANGAFAIADSLHLERIQLVNHAPTLGSQPAIIHAAYAAYGVFLLQQCSALLISSAATGVAATAAVEQSARSLRDKARAALKAAYNAAAEDVTVGLLYVNLLIDCDQQAQAEAVLLDLLATQLARRKPTGFRLSLGGFDDGFDGYESDDLCPVDCRCYVLLAALSQSQGNALKARKALRLANRSFIELDEQPPVSTHGSPRRTLVLLLARTSSYCFQHSFFTMGHACLQLALDCENAATAKATARGKPAMTVPLIRCLLKEAQSLAALCTSNNKNSNSNNSGGYEAAVVFAEEMLLVADLPTDVVRSYVTLAGTLQQQQAGAVQSQSRLVEAYLQAVQTAQSRLSLQQVREGKTVPLEVFCKAGKLLIMSGRFAETLSLLLYACSVYSSATLLMLLGVCCLRLDELDDAEAALVEANMLDNRNADIWAYLSLVCVSSGPHRIYEAEKSLQQSLRLGQSNGSLLRELATSFMSVDKLQTAEDLIRRAIAAEAGGDSNNNNSSSNSSSKKVSNAHSRKLLADILAGQNQAAKAVEEYQAVLGDDALDVSAKLEAAQRCGVLLKSLGRSEELAVLREIIHSLETAVAADGGTTAAAAGAVRPQMM